MTFDFDRYGHLFPSEEGDHAKFERGEVGLVGVAAKNTGLFFATKPRPVRGFFCGCDQAATQPETI
jgi:hypothetical protein